MTPVIAIDGPSGSGKGAVSRRVARALDYHLLDSGALYRLVGISANRAGIIGKSDSKIVEIARNLAARFDWDEAGEERIWLEGQDVTLEVRAESTGELASQVAVLPAVREALLDLQHSYQAPPGLVADGRDMGTVVFPDAPIKVYLTACAEERARRRHKQLKEKGIGVSLPALFQEIAARDERDANRPVAPLVPAEDSVQLDSTDMSVDEVVRTVLDLAASRLELRFAIDD